MRAPLFDRTRAALALGVGATLVGCAVPTHTTRIADGPEPVDVELSAARLVPGQAAQLVVRSPGADSIAFESINGVDRYWTDGPRLETTITSDFGDPVPVQRFAGRYEGQVLSLLKKPARVAICRQGSCREFQHEIAVKLPERNQRSVALTAGMSSVFARRSIRGANRTVLFEEVLNSAVWSVQGEWAASGWNGRVHGFLGADDRGGSLDLSRVLKRSDGVSYGLAMHLGTTHTEWLDRTAYHVSFGPSLMLRGVTASSQFGIYADGTETLQIASTRVSINGNLTSVRHPVTVTAEKTFAFGGGAIIARRRDALERLTVGIRVLDDIGLNIGVSSHRIAWPVANPSEDLRASETLVTLGGQYSVAW